MSCLRFRRVRYLGRGKENFKVNKKQTYKLFKELAKKTFGGDSIWWEYAYEDRFYCTAHFRINSNENRTVNITHEDIPLMNQIYGWIQSYYKIKNIDMISSYKDTFFDLLVSIKSGENPVTKHAKEISKLHLEYKNSEYILF